LDNYVDWASVDSVSVDLARLDSETWARASLKLHMHVSSPAIQQ
jgi:hypothetical protein